VLRHPLASALVAIGSAAGVAAGFHWSAGWSFAVFSGLYALAHLVLFPNPSGRGVTLVPGIAAVAALASNGSAAVILGSAAVALPIGMVAVHLRHGRRIFDRIYPAEPIGLVAFTVVFSGGAALFQVDAEKDLIDLLLLLAGGVAWFVTAAVTRALFSRQGASEPRRLILTRALEDWPAYASLVSSAALYEFTDDTVGVIWALVLAGLPYAFGHVSLHRAQTTRHTYRQTIEALGRMPEAAGIVPTGTAAGVAELSLATAAEYGLSGGEIARVESAAMLHDIGRVVLANPAVASGEYSAQDVARWSAAIISEARYLEPVAEVILGEHEPYRRVGQTTDPAVPATSRILRVVTAFTRALQDGTEPLEAIEVLHRGAAYEFDPDVVLALRRVLARRGVIAA